MKRRLVALSALLMLAASEGGEEPLRIAVVADAEGPCAPLGADAEAGERAYYAHLAGRLEADVLRCPMADETAAAAAVAEGRADLAVVGGEAFAPVADKARAILTVRPRGAPNRIPVVLAVKKDSPARDLTDLRGAALGLDGRSPQVISLARTALADYGADAGFFGAEVQSRGYDSVAADLRAGRVGAMALHAGAWQAHCRGDTPTEDRCGDLRVVWRARPRAERAVIIAKDMSDERRFRLIGIHVAMHLETPQAFAFAAAWTENADAFEPAEADALVLQSPAV